MNFMLKLLASIFIALNPLSVLFPVIPITQDASHKEAPLFFSPSNSVNLTPAPSPALPEERNDTTTYQLPIQADIFLATQQLLPVFPIRDWNVPEPEISAAIALIYDAANHQILFQKNGIYERRPIASLTKLMTALVVLENADLNASFKISKEAVQTEGEMGSLLTGEELTIKSLLYALLVQSSNDAAVALAENIPFSLKDYSGQASGTSSTQKFVELMNQKAKSMGLKKTSFADPSGLSPENYSSAWDIEQLLLAAVQIPVLQKIMQTKQINLRSNDDRFNHYLVSTNKLLGVIPEIVGGKTGYTEEAGNCMALALKSPSGEGLIITVVMDAKDRLSETKTLFEWTKRAFLW